MADEKIPALGGKTQTGPPSKNGREQVKRAAQSFENRESIIGSW